MQNIVYIMCTNVGRAIIKAHLRYHQNIPISKIFCLSNEKGMAKSNYDNYSDLKKKYNLPIKYVNSINSSNVLNELKELNPTLIIQSGWSQKFSNKLLEIPTYGCIGQHPSPIPKGRGAATINWALINGEKDWADSFFLMNDEYDSGMVVAQKAIKILEEDTVLTLYNKVAWTSFCIIKNYLGDWINGEFDEVNNKGIEPSYFKPRTPKDGEINSMLSADQQMKYIRALTDPFPGAFFMLNEEKIVVWKAACIKAEEINENLIKFSDHIFLSNTKIYLKGSCGNYVLPILLEGEKFPKINVLLFRKNFI